MIRCIQCGRKNSVRQLPNGNYWCSHCSIQFDPSDDGNVGREGPQEHAERKEEYIRRRQGRRPA